MPKIDEQPVEEEAEEKNGINIDYIEGTMRTTVVGVMLNGEPFESLSWVLKAFYAVVLFGIIYYLQQFLLYMVAGVYKNCYHSWFWRIATLLVASFTVMFTILWLDSTLDAQKEALSIIRHLIG